MGSRGLPLAHARARRSNPLVNGLLPRIKESLAGDVTDVVALGADTLDGRATLRYEFPVSIPGLQLEGQTSVWVDEATKLPVQVVFTGAWGGLSYRTIQRIEYTAASRSPHRFLDRSRGAHGPTVPASGADAPSSDAAFLMSFGATQRIAP